MIKLTLIFFTIVQISAFAQSEYPIRMGNFPERNEFWKIYADAIHGDVSSATIADQANRFPDDAIEPILQGLDGRVSELEIKSITNTGSTQFTNVFGNLWGFRTEFSVEPVQVWNVMFPEGKTLDPNGAFIAQIWGMTVGDSYEVIKGEGGVDLGIQFHLETEFWPIGVKGRGLFQLVDAVDPGFPPHDGDAVALPGDPPGLGLSGHVLRY